jgi:hypothetical protein
MAPPHAKRCRMIKDDGSRCKGRIHPGSFQFCEEHVPIAFKWKERLEIAALTVSSAELIAKLVELALKLPEFFGSGVPDQKGAKEAILRDFTLSAWDLVPNLTSFAPGSRVDWVALRAVWETAKRLRNPNATVGDIEAAEAAFDTWFEDMNDYHRATLLEFIKEERTKQTGA